jgi:2-keto-3-deoxy-L-rhamnonate aldolase RhmA
MSAATRPDPRAFRERLLAREPLIGTFMKTPGPHNTEILAGLGYDFVMLDEEHAPWTRATLDAFEAAIPDARTRRAISDAALAFYFNRGPHA